MPRGQSYVNILTARGRNWGNFKTNFKPVNKDWEGVGLFPCCLFFAAVRVFEKMVRASKQCLLLQVLVVCLILVLAPLADGYSCSHEVYG